MRSELNADELGQLTAICRKFTTTPVRSSRRSCPNDEPIPTRPNTLNLVVISAGTSDPSSTRLLADRPPQGVAALARESGALP